MSYRPLARGLAALLVFQVQLRAWSSINCDMLASSLPWGGEWPDVVENRNGQVYRTPAPDMTQGGKGFNPRGRTMASTKASNPSYFQKEHPLHAAAARGDAVAVRKMLAESALPDGTIPALRSRLTPLDLCCASTLGDIRDREACVAALLEAGADPGHNSPWGPVYHAVRYGRERILAMLIEAGGSVNERNSDGWTLLHVAAKGDYFEATSRGDSPGSAGCIVRLIAAGADVKVVTPGMPSPFVPAILRRLTRTYPHFLQAGAVIPTIDELRRFSGPGCYDENELQDPYLQKVLSAGSFANYAKAHRARLLAILAPRFPHLPKEMVSVVIDFWAHVGFY